MQVPKGDVQKRGRKRGPRVYEVCFMPKSTPGVSLEAAMNMESLNMTGITVSAKLRYPVYIVNT